MRLISKLNILLSTCVLKAAKYALNCFRSEYQAAQYGDELIEYNNFNTFILSYWNENA